jgi:LuxR family maltose regulon positive regulatory protein
VAYRVGQRRLLVTMNPWNYHARMPIAGSRRKRPVLGKLMPPRLGRVFDRERLFALLDTRFEAPGVWIAGPPGVGKTTLVATYFEARSVQTLWLQIDAGDADPAAFVHFLNLALADAMPHRRLRLAAPTADDLRDVAGFIRRCLRYLAATLEVPWVLVLDNMQEIATASHLYAGLATMLAELPPAAHLIFISRDLPPAAFTPALAGQQLGLLDAKDLRFTLDETRALVELHGHQIQADALQESTDGWAAAMILIMATGGTLAPNEAINNGRARGQLFAFFAGEVLARMPPGDAAALACTPSCRARRRPWLRPSAGIPEPVCCWLTSLRAACSRTSDPARNPCTPFTRCSESSCARTRRPH